jgi:hypothetical protein
MINTMPTTTSDELTPEELRQIYIAAFEEDWDALPPITTVRCPDCYMMLEDFMEHHCIRSSNVS